MPRNRAYYQEMEWTPNNTLVLPSLLSLSINEVLKVLSQNLDDIEKLPTNVKEKLLHLMCKRGMVSDSNISKVVTAKTRILDLSESNISDEALSALRICRNLRKLDLNCTKGVRENITADGLQQVATSCPYLQAVSLRRCVDVTDAGIISLARSCPQLRELNIGGCKKLTDASLVAISQSCRFLRSINFSNTKVTDEGVITLVMGDCQKEINEIHMSHCVHLTNESIEAITMFCPNVSTLIFHGCPCITESSRQILQGPQFKMKQLTWTIY
ncbi:Protein AMN1-like [Holothuria leucospilota]|uniref:Protein AMN1 homolog n=1 Tax=Holothuria leucospilota TaxID=206669 RepID=A0A9Q1H3H4_HOLLE|nr:Protein AMN1-like [Holothuria leucospilota]